jgi:hypothetical protein
VSEPVAQKTISVEVNGTTYEREVEARRLLVHFLRAGELRVSDHRAEL